MSDTVKPPPWECCSMHDRSGRRGIWYRTSPGVIEVCGGREGDDDYVRLAVGEVLTAEHLKALEECLRTGAWMLEERADGPRPLDPNRERYAEKTWRAQHSPGGNEVT